MYICAGIIILSYQQRITEIAGVVVSFDPKPIDVRNSFHLIFVVAFLHTHLSNIKWRIYLR